MPLFSSFLLLSYQLYILLDKEKAIHSANCDVFELTVFHVKLPEGNVRIYL